MLSMEETAQLALGHLISHPHHFTVPISYYLPGSTSSFCYFPDGRKGVKEKTVTIFLIKMWYDIPQTGSHGSALLHKKVRTVGAFRVRQCSMNLLSWGKKEYILLFFALALNPLKWQVFSLLIPYLHFREILLMSAFGWRNHIVTVLTSPI